jgi:hypothetical protein
VTAKPACRLFVLPAREAPRAVVLRRGPAAWAHVLLWHTDTDELVPGAWFRGRIYEERCDVSPDGELLLYFALQGRKFQTDYKGSWTAVSRAPWLEALTLWPQGDTWGGGGRFTGRREIVLRIPGSAHPEHPVRGLAVSSGGAPGQVATEKVDGAEWAGRDFAGHVIFAAGGGLFRRTAQGDRLVADLNGLEPDPQPAPAWAGRPLRS